MDGDLILEKILFMSKKLEIRDIKPGLIIINNAISSIYQYIERVDEVRNYSSITITSCCRNKNLITTNDEIQWYSMGTFYQPLDESFYNSRKARINEVWYFNLNIIEEGRSLYE